MKKRVVLFLLSLSLPLFLLFSFRVTVSAEEPIETKKITVNVGGDVDGNGVPILNAEAGQVTKREPNSPYGNNNELIALPAEGFVFSFYLENNYVVSINSHYKFRTTDDHVFMAFFRPVNRRQILVVDANNRYLGSLLKPSSDTVINESDIERFRINLNERPGYEFDKWSVEFPLEITSGLTVIKAEYRPKQVETFQVNVFADGIKQETKSVDYGKTTTVVAPIVQGEKFDYWKIGNEIVSYDNNYTFNVYSSVDITAVYTAGEPNDEPIIYLYESPIVENDVMYFLSQSYIPADYEIIEQGIIFKNTLTSQSEDILITDSAVQRLRAARVSPNNGFSISLNTIDYNYLYVRSYLIIKVGETTRTIYSKQFSKQFVFNVTYNLDGGILTNPKTEFKEKDFPYTLPNPTKNGYEFQGWYNNSGGTGTRIYTIDKTNTYPLTLYAKFTLVTYEIGYNLNGGSWTWQANTVSSAVYGINDYSVLPDMFMLDFFTYLKDNNLLSSTIVHESLRKTTWAQFSVLSGDPIASYNKTSSNFSNDTNGYSQFFFNTATGDPNTGEILTVNGGFFGTEPYKSKYFNLLKHIARLCQYTSSTAYREDDYRIWAGQTGTSKGRSMMGFILDGYFYGTQGEQSGVFQQLRRTIPNTNTEYKVSGTTLQRIDVAYQQTNYTVNSQEIILKAPVKNGTVFLGWYDNPSFSGNKIEKIPKGSTGSKQLYAKWGSQTSYKITLHQNRSYTITTKNNMATDFLTDFYNYLKTTDMAPTENLQTFIHGAGKTSGFAGTWDNVDTYKTKLYAANDKSSDASKPYFINQPVYNLKWIPLFDMLHQITIDRSDSGLFWASTYTGIRRINLYFQNKTLSQEHLDRIPTFSATSITYTAASATYTLPVLSVSGKTFGGWYTVDGGKGLRVTSVPSGSMGNKVYYAKWS